MGQNDAPRFVIERQDGITECQHPLCDTLHQRFHEYSAGGGAMHDVLYVQWHVWDNERDDYASHEAREFSTKREAKAWLDGFLLSKVKAEREHYCRVVAQPHRQQGMASYFYASCRCGWAGSGRRTTDRAWDDGKDHMKESQP